MDLRIAGRKALVLGSSRGLGRAIAAALIAEGVEVAICARNLARLESTAREIGASAFATDLSLPGAAAALVREVSARLGPPDILVVNTGGPPPGSFDEVGDEAWRGAFEALWMSAVGAVRACLPAMRARRWGRILFVTSTAAREPFDRLMLSNALRPGLHGLINALSREVAGDGVTVNALMPSSTRTDRLVELGVDELQLAREIPAGRLGTPEEFAAVATFLASDPAAYVTGQAIAVDGGALRSI